MGKCKYCHRDAGWFQHSHSECEKKYNDGKLKLRNILMSCFSNLQDFYCREQEINEIISSSYIDEATKEKIFVDVLDDVIEKYLEDNIINDAEKQSVARFIQFSQIPQAILNQHHSIEKMLQADVIQDILNGNKPSPKITIAGNFPFMLSRNETMIWLFRDIIFYEQKIKREYVGRSSGISVRVAKGIYYRTGGFRGHPVETTYMQRISVGSVCLTDKHIYFSSPEKSFRLSFDKIINIDTYSNGVGLQKNGANSKPIFLEGINSWFVYNVIMNLRHV